MHLYHSRVVTSQPSPDVYPSDCVRTLASRSEIHTDIVFSGSVFAMLTRFAMTVSILSASRISSPAPVCSMTSFISGLTASCSTLLIYCSRNPVSCLAAALDSSVSSVSLDVMIVQLTMTMATMATIRNTRITLLPICIMISSAIRFLGLIVWLCMLI